MHTCIDLCVGVQVFVWMGGGGSLYLKKDKRPKQIQLQEITYIHMPIWAPKLSLINKRQDA